MKNPLLYLTLFLVGILFTACQKELNFDRLTASGIAAGTLKASSGTCLPSSVNGTFTKDSVLTSANYIQVTANITDTGTFLISSDTISGFYFSGSGRISSFGNVGINLSGAGTPASTGVKTFTIKFGTSTCKIDVTVVAGTAASTAYSFINCSGTVFGPGVYTAGTAVGPQHTVTLNVSVTVPGAYSISTPVINGISFSGSGTFTTPGNTQVTLTASGTPLVGSPPPYDYTVSSGTSSCTFSISVVPVTVQNQDYVPQTDFSNWSSRLVGGTPADTTYIQVSTSSISFSGNSYKIFEVKNMGVPTDSVFNRKNGGRYYQYIDGNLGVLTNPINKEYLVLDSTLPVNSTWVVNFGPNVAMGFPLSNIRINALILAKGETQTVASIVYNNVIRMKYTYTATVIGVGDVPVAEEERWFARGKGVIRSSVVNLINPATTVNETTRTQIF